MYRVRGLLKKMFTPVTIMFIPHSSRRSLTMSVPSVFVGAVIVFALLGMGYVASLARDAFLYKPTKEKLDYYTSEISDLQSTISSLKLAEKEFNRIFSKGTKQSVIENLDTSDSGSIDMGVLKSQIEQTIQSVGEIRDYLSQTRELYRATPMGEPVHGGHITSVYGSRIHPIKGVMDFHTGIDFSISPGEPVMATADGIVSFAGINAGSGNLVAIEHGHGYSTYYAHNRQILVQVGQIVKRGDVISYVGSTGSSTGPHVHYEIWKDGHTVNPQKYLNWRKS